MQTRWKSETGRRFFGRVASALVRFVVVVFFAILFFHLFVHGEEDFVRGTERGEPQTRQPPRRRCRQRSSKPGKKNKTKQKQNAVLVEPTPSPPPPPPGKKAKKNLGERGGGGRVGVGALNDPVRMRWQVRRIMAEPSRWKKKETERKKEVKSQTGRRNRQLETTEPSVGRWRRKTR